MTSSVETPLVNHILNVVDTKLQNHIAETHKLFRDNAAKIEKVCSLMSDEQSRNLFLQQISFLDCYNISREFAERFNPLPASKWQKLIDQSADFFAQHKIPELKYRDEYEQESAKNCRINTFFLETYKYGDIVKVEEGDVFLDCGASLGDTSLWAYLNGAKAVYSFEPCIEAIPTLKLNLESNGHPKNIVPCAVSNKASSDSLCVNRFCRGASYMPKNLQDNQHLDNDYYHLEEIFTIRLDDWCKKQGVEPTFIKMDIEGSELAALEGCAETIKCLKPKLAICLYHSTSDAWEIPLYVHSLVPEYKFYCRKCHPVWDFILYATV